MRMHARGHGLVIDSEAAGKVPRGLRAPCAGQFSFVPRLSAVFRGRSECQMHAPPPKNAWGRGGVGGSEEDMAHLIRVIGDMSPPVQLSVSSDSSVRNCHSLSTCTGKASSDLGFSIGFRVTGFRQTPDLRGKPLLLGLVPRRSRHEDAMSCGVAGKRARRQY